MDPELKRRKCIVSPNIEKVQRVFEKESSKVKKDSDSSNSREINKRDCSKVRKLVEKAEKLSKPEKEISNKPETKIQSIKSKFEKLIKTTEIPKPNPNKFTIQSTLFGADVLLQNKKKGGNPKLGRAQFKSKQSDNIIKCNGGKLSATRGGSHPI